MLITTSELQSTPPPADLPKNTVEQRAAELATKIRKEGMGILSGKFCGAVVDYGPASGFTKALGFIKGEEVLDKEGNRLLSSLIENKTPYELTQSRGPEDRQVWVITPYSPPSYTSEVRKGFFRKEKIQVRRAFNGKSGEEGWVQYDYYTNADNSYDISKRPGVFVNLSIAVPLEIADQIDAELQKNVLFPDALFKALYPGRVGSDPSKFITRKPAKELLLIDRRNNPNTLEGFVKPYPQPLEY